MCKNEYNDEDSHKKQNELRCARGKSGAEEQGLMQTGTIGASEQVLSSAAASAATSARTAPELAAKDLEAANTSS